MYTMCVTEKTAEQQKQFEQCFLQMMMEYHYDEITISDLCEQMDIPRKSFYRYFSSKDGALHALIDHTLLDFEQHTGILSGNAAGDAHQDLRHFFEFWHQRKQLLDALERSGLSGVLVQRAIAQAQNEYVLPRYPTSAEVRQIQSHAITFSICGLMSMVTRWHRSGYAESVQEMANIATALLTKPLIQG